MNRKPLRYFLDCLPCFAVKCQCVLNHRFTRKGTLNPLKITDVQFQLSESKIELRIDAHLTLIINCRADEKIHISSICRSYICTAL